MKDFETVYRPKATKCIVSKVRRVFYDPCKKGFILDFTFFVQETTKGISDAQSILYALKVAKQRIKPMYKKCVKLWPCKKACAFVPCESGKFMAQGPVTLKIADVSETEKLQLT